MDATILNKNWTICYTIEHHEAVNRYVPNVYVFLVYS